MGTSAVADELDHYLSLINVGDLLDVISCGDEVDHDKPDPALIDVALLRAGNVPPGNAVNDAMAAKRAGVRAIGMRSGSFSRQELEASGCIAV